jgi:hypothetical protein
MKGDDFGGGSRRSRRGIFRRAKELFSGRGAKRDAATRAPIRTARGLDSPTPSVNLSTMRYFVQFLQQDIPYFVLPSEGDGVGLQQLAQDIIRYYFVEGSDEPQPIPPDPRIPNEIRILDEAGNIIAKWSLDDECARRREDKLP